MFSSYKAFSDETTASLFKDTYAQSREAFLQATQGKSQVFHFKSTQGKDYTIDYFVQSAIKKKQTLFIIFSGIHGIEGFVGSAVQRFWLQTLKQNPLPENFGLVMVHGLNPFGFSELRRVNENNIDLNRNFVLNSDVYSSRNESYEKINPFLNPEEPAEHSFFSNLKFYYNAIKYVVQFSLPVLRRAVLQGQYQFDQGIFFGGKEYQPQQALIDQLIATEASQYENTFVIDLHTGYGQKGKLHMLVGTKKAESPAELSDIFGENNVEYGDKKDFYMVYGDLISYVMNQIKNKYKKNALGIAFEYGTLDSQKLKGTIDSLHRMILENQSHWHAAKTPEDKKEIDGLFREMFAPSDTAWQQSCLEQTQQAMQKLMSYYTVKAQ